MNADTTAQLPINALTGHVQFSGHDELITPPYKLGLAKSRREVHRMAKDTFRNVYVRSRAAWYEGLRVSDCARLEVYDTSPLALLDILCRRNQLC
jgi:hypothetical protein